MSKVDPSTMADLKVDPSEWLILQARRQEGGKGSSLRLDKKYGRGHVEAKGGFFLVKEESKTLKEMLNDEVFRPYAEGLIERLKTVVNSYKKSGLIK